MDDRRGVPLSADLAAAFNSEPVGLHGSGPRKGFFVALEGGEGAGKSTQARALARWLESLGHDVVVTFEPGATEVGRRLRSVLLDHPEPSTEGAAADVPPALAARTEALLFAADRAEHVATVVAPALALGHVVVSDRYTDSSVAYQGAGRELSGTEVGRLSRWATDGLQPQLTVVLDVPAAEGLARVEAPDRLESEPIAFHERVRERFLELARRGGSRYLVVDGTLPPEQITAAIRARLEPVLPLSALQIREAAAARAAEEERRRVAEEARRLAEARARADAAERARKEALEAEARLAQAAAEAEQRRVLEEAEAAERARLAAIAAAEAAQVREEHARQRALHAEERRRQKEEQRLAREQGAGHHRPAARAHRRRVGRRPHRPVAGRRRPADPPVDPDRRAVRHRRRRRAGRQHRAAPARPSPARRPVTGAAGGVWVDLVGQEPTVAVLRRAAEAAEAGRRGEAGTGMTHAWLFTGPPGSGRSTAARAFAAALQCPHGGCGDCAACHTVLVGTHADVEVDQHPQAVDRGRRRPGAGVAGCPPPGRRAVAGDGRSRTPTGSPTRPATRCSRRSRNRRRTPCGCCVPRPSTTSCRRSAPGVGTCRCVRRRPPPSPRC